MKHMALLTDWSTLDYNNLSNTFFFKAPHSTLNHHNLSHNIHLEPEISDKPKHIDTKHIHMNIIIESHRDKTNKMVCASSEDSDQPGHLPSLISLCCLHEERSLATHKAHSEDSDQTGRTCHFVGFVMMRLSCLNISNFLNTSPENWQKNLPLKGNKNHLLGSTNLLVKTAHYLQNKYSS